MTTLANSFICLLFLSYQKSVFDRYPRPVFKDCMEDQRVPGVSKAFADKGPSCYDEGAHRAEDKCHLNDGMFVAVPSNRTRNCFIYQGGQDGLTHSGDDNVEDDVPHNGVGESHLRHLRTLEVEEHKRQEVE